MEFLSITFHVHASFQPFDVAILSKMAILSFNTSRDLFVFCETHVPIEQ